MRIQLMLVSKNQMCFSYLLGTMVRKRKLLRTLCCI